MFDVNEMLSRLFSESSVGSTANPISRVPPFVLLPPSEGTSDSCNLGVSPSSPKSHSREPLPTDEVNSDDNDFYWQNIDSVDFAYLTRPRHYHDPCSWCGGRLRHSKACDDLRADWEPTIPFGRYKGRRVSETPLDYLSWLTMKKIELPADLRRAISQRLAKYRDN